MARCININLKKDKIVVKISEEAKQEEIVEELTKKIIQLKKLYQEEKTPIQITGKVLKNSELEEVKQIIQNEIEVEIETDIPKTLGLYSIKKTFNKQIDNSDTQFYRGALRSGQRLEVEGSIVILGDVNSGAEVISGENIVVLGTLRGLAHAGAKGNNGAIIAAGALDTVQLRISNVVKEIEKEEILPKQAYVYIQDDKIVIE